MKIEVEKVFQSPCTPVQECDYLVRFVDMHKDSPDADRFWKLIKEFEDLSNSFKKGTVMES